MLAGYSYSCYSDAYSEDKLMNANKADDNAVL